MILRKIVRDFAENSQKDFEKLEESCEKFARFLKTVQRNVGGKGK